MSIQVLAFICASNAGVEECLKFEFFRSEDGAGEWIAPGVCCPLCHLREFNPKAESILRWGGVKMAEMSCRSWSRMFAKHFRQLALNQPYLNCQVKSHCLSQHLAVHPTTTSPL